MENALFTLCRECQTQAIVDLHAYLGISDDNLLNPVAKETFSRKYYNSNLAYLAFRITSTSPASSTVLPLGIFSLSLRLTSSNAFVTTIALSPANAYLVIAIMANTMDAAPHSPTKWISTCISPVRPPPNNPLKKEPTNL